MARIRALLALRRMFADYDSGENDGWRAARSQSSGAAFRPLSAGPLGSDFVAAGMERLRLSVGVITM